MRTAEKRLSRSKSSLHRLPLPTPRGLLAALLIHRTIGLIDVEDLRPARRRELRSVSIEALPATQFEIENYHL
ncbi:hypothetical protein LHYA1_G007606 [Lachnellula hyalina]|uniref:Uncharacterized protein n=1 Tax=Lachnellula hyalina TaxID=1316788 RepID=A0A8H8QXX6_9HELO|nr:uncharacterized protein LHYA1_G007606 [Lachnellula hyalina]TVY23389.1 hypothetical protein LHYA1_G007606 [Lachnellula hyalina]